MQSLAIPEIKTPAVPAEKDVLGFVALVQKGIEAWQEAGRRLVIALEKDPKFCARIRAAHPEISRDMLTVFERIGRKQIYAPLLADTSLGARRLLEMPYDLQEKYAKGEVEVVTDWKTGATVRRRVSDLSKTEVRQVFDWNEVLTPKAQISNLRGRHEQLRAAPAAVPKAQPTKVERLGCYIAQFDGDKVVLVPCRESINSQQVRVKKSISGQMVAEILFYSMP